MLKINYLFFCYLLNQLVYVSKFFRSQNYHNVRFLNFLAGFFTLFIKYLIYKVNRALLTGNLIIKIYFAANLNIEMILRNVVRKI